MLYQNRTVAIISLSLLALSAAPVAAQTTVLQAEALLPAVSYTDPIVKQNNCCGVSWSAGAQLWFKGTAAGDNAVLNFTVATSGQYDVSAILTQAPNYGQVRYAIDGISIGQSFDGYASSTRKTTPVPLGSVALTAGVHQFRITILGKYSSATGHYAGIDTITLDRRGALPAVTNTAYSIVAETPSSGTFAKIYDPSIGETGAWYYNDHSIIQDQATGTWHAFAITHAEPANPQDEKNFGHATAPSLAGPWTKQPFALTADPAAGELYIWAPHVIYDNGTYYMFYAAGTSDLTQYRMHLATSTDLFNWTRSSANPLFYSGWEGRDPMVIRVGNEWVMYYTATSSPSGGNHIVAYRTSTDLLTWGAQQTAFVHPQTGAIGGPTESPFVVQRNGFYYLFLCGEGNQYVATAVYRSQDPFRFEYANRIGGILPSHAAEVVVDGSGNSYITHAGWGQGGLWLAPLTWTSGEVARGRVVSTSYYQAHVQTWPTSRIVSMAVDPAGNGNYQTALDSSYRTTTPYLAIGTFGPSDYAGAAPTVQISADGTRINMVGMPFGSRPVTADWLLTFNATGLQSDMVYRVTSTINGVWEVTQNLDTALPCVGDAGNACRSGDVAGFPSWAMGSGPSLSMIAAYRTASAWRTDNRWYQGPHGMIAWQPIWRNGGTSWTAGLYKGGTFRLVASGIQYDSAFANQLATDLNTVK